MKITLFETMSADAAWRTFSFLKIGTDSGIVGWAEYSDTESFGSARLTQVLEGLKSVIMGRDPRPTELLVSTLHTFTRHAARGGLIQQAIGAIENALLDIKAKDLGLPVYALLGGPLRDRIPVYWSHAGTYRVHSAAALGVPPLRNYDDLAQHGADIRRLGFKALKTNIFLQSDGRLASFAPGLGLTPGWPELNCEPETIRAVIDTLGAFRAGAGPDAQLMIDLNFYFRTEGFLRLARAVEPYQLAWLELDANDPSALSLVRKNAPCAIASLETLSHRRDFRPYFEANAVDVAIIDLLWSGVGEAIKIAAMADAYDINIAPHNYYGHLATAMTAHFCATIPNFRIMEVDIDSAPWRDEFVTELPLIENGELVLSDRPGWGLDINEAAVRARPPRR
ncbi:mandelate racemase/muconate lactonizing enzyme family protein [Acidisoma silvae]|uniref:Mandelate racemase/muconate lactonizing enzyme family protein n=1 Tax=Acidisoma silvae TaxID=2802396 RepID=A0A964E1B1_9PROT|nr:mandelate racemase/muconate lactonizing enzyme family protein [Acidisoma silvae]MCB8878039.1 mandelate racemase/muconate lactonizing enzyme family protein [Acidisoma silvae]